MDFTAWWKGVEPIFQFGFAVGCAIVLLGSFLLERKRMLAILEKLATVTVKQEATLSEIRRSMDTLRDRKVYDCPIADRANTHEQAG